MGYLSFYLSTVEHGKACFTEQIINLACKDRKYFKKTKPKQSPEELPKYTKVALVLHLICQQEFLLFQVNQIFLLVYLYNPIKS